MRKIIVFLFFNFCLSAEEIVLVRPKEAEKLPRLARGVIVAGNIAGSSLRELWINKERVEVYRTGSFMTYIPISWSENRFSIVVSTSQITPPIIERVIITDPRIEEKIPEKILSSLEPRQDLIELPPGELLNLSFQAPEKGRARFKIGSVTGKLDMEETRGGFYQARFVVTANDLKEESRGGELIVFFEEKSGESYKIPTKKIIRFSKVGYWPRTAKVTSSRARVLASPAAGNYWFSVSSGSFLSITGVFGNLYRTRLGAALNGWVSQEEISLVKTYQKSSVVEFVEILESTQPYSETWVRLGVRGSPRIPFVVEEISKSELRLRLFNSNVHINWIPYRPNEQASLVESVSWTIPQEDEVSFQIKLREPLYWGYWTESPNEHIILRLRHERPMPPLVSVTPSPSKTRKKVINPYKQWLLGKVVMIDPGHGGNDKGALAPSGAVEAEANRQLSFALAKKLESLGAKAVLTRSLDENLSLEERVEKARKENPDYFISVHCNDLANWINPFEKGPWGYSFYYYLTNSLTLARVLEGEFNKGNLYGIPDTGLLRGDLYVLRELTIPVVLVESGYLLFPWQEELLIWDEKFRNNYVDAIARALERYTMEASTASR